MEKELSGFLKGTIHRIYARNNWSVPEAFRNFEEAVIWTEEDFMNVFAEFLYQYEKRMDREHGNMTVPTIEKIMKTMVTGKIHGRVYYCNPSAYFGNGIIRNHFATDYNAFFRLECNHRMPMFMQPEVIANRAKTVASGVFFANAERDKLKI